MSDTAWFSSIFEELRVRNARAHASLLAPAALPLRAWLEQRIGAQPGAPDGLLSTPVFEHKFGFCSSQVTMADLVQRGELCASLARNMAKPPPEFRSQAFPGDRHPYTHQIAAWAALKRDAPTSVVVSAGTGAGKTECFLVPILDDLARQADTRKGALEGVQALFLYPLNALINSQRERLSAWTRGFDGDVRYCLYNGETEHRVARAKQRAHPERVLSRALLRTSPPPLLITNATMLEYMLVRPDDAPILTASRGRLRYIVIDEAHTYMGSMAAELALLLRRVMNAFEVDPKTVRFVATSATLSSDDSGDAVEDLRSFLADIAGQHSDGVEVIRDERAIPALPTVPVVGDIPNLEAVASMPPEERFQTLCGHAAPLALRRVLVDDGAHQVRELVRRLDRDGLELAPDGVVRLLDLCRSAVPATADGDPPADAFLPLRGHIFARGLDGLWTCLNPHCPGRADGPLDSGAWPFGAVYSGQRGACTACGGPVFEVALCQQCGTEVLPARLCEGSDGFELASAIAYDALADPPAETEELQTGDDVDAADDDGDDDDAAPHVDLDQVRLLVRAEPMERASVELDPRVPLDPKSGDVDPQDGGSVFGMVRAGPDGRMHCPHCGKGDTRDRLFFRSCRTGRNFILGVSVPVLLEHMRAEEPPGDLPLQGRRTISFTDSRQGTARFAARSQGEAERNYVRSFIYHQVMSEQGTDPTEVARLERELANQRQAQDALRASGADPSLLDGQIAALTDQLAAQRGTRAVPLTTVAQRLAVTSSFHHLHKYWRDYLPFRETGIEAGTLAKWLVMREFARRPMRRASLETLGLVAVRFPKVDHRRPPPTQWRAWAGAQAEQSWRDFLKLLLDFYVRSNSAVELDNEFFRWVGTTIQQKAVGGPGTRPVRNRRVSWPRFSARTRPRLGWLVVRAFGLNADDRAALERVNDVLDQAWEYLKPALKRAQDGRQLAMEQMLLEPVSCAWLCPLTRMLLDTTLLGHTPYQPPLDRPFDTRAQPVRVPQVPEPFWEGAEARQWLDEDPLVLAARERGALTEFAERVLSFSPYYQVAEHSAQLQTSALNMAEKQFRRGILNLLSCSTTMEMGVDIGNLSGIAMNNAPPSPANFLQRVGRAGRRGETAAISLTVCRHLPHDQAVFAEPDWPFRTPMHITPVKLDSQRIVERHVRATALTWFLHTVVGDQSILRLNCAWFFLSESDQDHSVCDRLVVWLQGEAAQDERLGVHLRRLVRESALEGVPVPTLLADCVLAFTRAQEEYQRLRNSILSQIDELPEEDRGESPAWFALDRQRERLDGEYLLGVLADQQVLPGYGFPTGVVPLVTLTIEELRALKAAGDRARTRRSGDNPESPEERNERVDARTRLMGFPTRDLPMAIREYAPGGNVVLERRTYAPRGVTLNWHLPPSADRASVRQVQSLRTAWRCPTCGATGTALGGAPRVCPTCGHPRLRHARYLEPAGFAVDLFQEATMDAEAPVFIPVEAPWISSGSGPLEHVGRPALVRFRHAHDGELVHLSAGVHGHGYAVCLRCGRAEPEVEPLEDGVMPPLPPKLDGHFRLRGGKGSGWRSQERASPCEGNDSSWAVQRHLRLGGSARTDVLEVHLLDPNSYQLLADRTLLTTAAVALRKEAARALGIDERELGYQLARRVEGGRRGFAILLYDTASGGAGFCAEIPALLPELLRRAVATCRCPRGCDQACHACLLSNDTQHDLEHIDRFSLAPPDGAEPSVLSEAYLGALELPDHYRVFGPDTRTLWERPHLGLLQRVRRMVGPAGSVLVQLHVYGEGSAWDPVAWPARRLVRALHDLGEVTVRLVLPERGLDALDWQQRRQLAGLAENEGIELFAGVSGTSESLRLWAEVSSGEEHLAFAADEPLTFDDTWATRPGEALHVYGPAGVIEPAGRALEPGDLLMPPQGGVVELDLRSAAWGPARELGRRVWAAVDAGAPGTLDEWRDRGPVRRVEVHDRYLVTPQTVQALYKVLSHLADRGVVGRETEVRVHALQAANTRGAPFRLGHNWARWEDQEAVMRGLLGVLRAQIEIHLVPVRERRTTQHHRSLVLEWAGPRVELRLDQGFGFLEPLGEDRFPFTGDVNTQVTRLLQGTWGIAEPHGRGRVPAYLIP